MTGIRVSGSMAQKGLCSSEPQRSQYFLVPAKFNLISGAKERGDGQ
jgi:hypothetical protein